MARLIPGFVTDLIGRTRRHRFGAWRWYSPGAVCLESGNECLPISLVPKLLLLCGSGSAEELMLKGWKSTALYDHERIHGPKDSKEVMDLLRHLVGRPHAE